MRSTQQTSGKLTVPTVQAIWGCMAMLTNSICSNCECRHAKPRLLDHFKQQPQPAQRWKPMPQQNLCAHGNEHDRNKSCEKLNEVSQEAHRPKRDEHQGDDFDRKHSPIHHSAKFSM